MTHDTQPVYMIGVAAELAGVHPQTLRQYERLGLVAPNRAAGKNRLFSQADILRVRRIQRLTQQMGVNLAGVELILRLLEEMEEMSRDFERQFIEYFNDAERRIADAMGQPTMPIRKGESILATPKIQFKRKVDL